MKPISISPPPEGVPLSDDEARALVAAAKWYHAFEIRPGLTTPGSSPFDAKPNADALKVPSRLQGKRALDIGAWDGPMTFELERRGASAFALDIQDPSRVGFGTARRILGSKAVHYQGSVYQLPCGDLRDLDLIVCRGVYYHLKHPLLAFERIAAALRLGGTLHFEGEGLINYAENLRGEEVKLNFADLNATDAPIGLFYPGVYKRSQNWFVPTPSCLKAMLAAAGLEVREMHVWTSNDPPFRGQRLYGYAVKTRAEAELEEHGLY
jgi:tRNA (mo5U34)-methyltransferase